MSERSEAPERGASPATTALSWAIFAVVATTLYFSTKVATTPRGTQAREDLQHLHMSLGLLALALVLPRLVLWWRAPLPPRPQRLPASAFAFARQTCLLLYVTILAFGLTGPVYAWSEGHEVVFFGLHVPALLDASYHEAVRFGYLHSMLGFFVLYLAGLAVLIALYQTVRYRVPIWRMLPGSG
jgi:cytochrome b561